MASGKLLARHYAQRVERWIAERNAQHDFISLVAIDIAKPARRFRDFTYRTRKSWSRRRRVVGKAEYPSKGANPRFVVTSLAPHKAAARRLYEALYCARGEMENRLVSGCVEVRISGGHRCGLLAITGAGDDSERRVGV